MTTLPTIDPKALSGYRKLKSLSQAELGALLGVSQTTISNWEKGNQAPSMYILPRLVDVLGVDLDALSPSKNSLRMLRGRIDYLLDRQPLEVLRVLLGILEYIQKSRSA